MFKVQIETTSAAFDGALEVELPRILREIARQVENGPFGEMALRDANGNTVGRAWFSR